MADVDRNWHRSVGIAAAVAAAVVAVGTPLGRARAETSSATLAETLFQEGRRLMAEKNYAAACPKLAESQRLDPATGTLLNLAVCHEEEGKLASAWTEFNGALAGARQDRRPDREKLARQHLTAIEPRLSRLTVDVPASVRGPGLDVRLDGASLGEAAWGVAAPVDPGPHEISASAPGKKPWSVRFNIGAALDNQKYEIGPFESEVAASPGSAAADAVKREAVIPTATASPPPAPLVSASAPPIGTTAPMIAAPAPAPRTRLRTISYVVGAAGGAALVVGAVSGALAFSRWGDRTKRCPESQSQCDQPAVDAYNQANSAATVSTVAFAAGLAAIGAGVVLWYRSRVPEPSPANRGATLSIAPMLTATGGSLQLEGRW